MILIKKLYLLLGVLMIVVSCRKHCDIVKNNSSNKIATVLLLSGADTLKYYQFSYTSPNESLAQIKSWKKNRPSLIYSFKYFQNYTRIDITDNFTFQDSILAHHKNGKFIGFSSINSTEISGATFDENDTLRGLNIGFNHLFNHEGIKEMEYDSNYNLIKYTRNFTYNFPLPLEKTDTLFVEYTTLNSNRFAYLQIDFLSSLYSHEEELLFFLTQNDIHTINNTHLIKRTYRKTSDIDTIQQINNYHYEFDRLNRVNRILLSIGGPEQSAFITYK